MGTFPDTADASRAFGPCDVLLDRRRFLFSAASATLAFAGTTSPLARAVAAAVNDLEVMTWTSCVVNCGSRCPLRVFSKNGRVIRIEPENTGADSRRMPFEVPHVRACLRGRSMRQRLYSQERLKYPMKRVGKRGEGKFERISWDEALDIVAKNLRHTIETYGNEAVYLQYGSGSYQLVSSRNTAARLLNMLGGFLNQYGTYSSAQINAAMPYTFGIGAGGSQMTEVANAELYVTFGHNPMVTRQSGGGQAWELECARTEGKKRPKMIVIDPIYTDTCLGKEDEWVPIRPGTDAALVEGIAYELIRNNWVDQAFLDTYCVGYDEKTLPKGAPAKSDYKSYILGLGPDQTPKTPEYASRITGVPAETILRLARLFGTTKPVFFAQGYGSQRQANGEQTVRAIAMLPILTGNIGLSGTNHGGREADISLGDVGLPAGKNPVKTAISFFTWVDAIDHGTEMTALNAGVRGRDRLAVPIKFLWNQCSNVMVNQHSDHNGTAKILADESKCEFILVIDNQMTSSAKFADILLPDVMQQELNDIAADGYATGTSNFMVALQKAVEPRWEERSGYAICTGLAERFGIKDRYTEGRSQEDWVRWCYEETRKKHPDAMPDFDTFWKQGIVKVPGLGVGRTVVLKDFREDPVKHKLKTPSGKIEIYSERLAEIATTWELKKDEHISALPQFVRTFEMPGDDLQKRYPLQCFGYHGHGRTHSTYHNVPWLREIQPDLLLINPIDARARGIEDGSEVEVFNDRGRVRIAAKVTSRIIPGVVAFPQGGWWTPGKDGVDRGPSINTLTSPRTSPLAKANPQHTNLVEVTSVRDADRSTKA